MPKKTVETYEITAKFSIRKDYWSERDGPMTIENIEDKIQQGIEVPIEDVKITIEK